MHLQTSSRGTPLPFSLLATLIFSTAVLAQAPQPQTTPWPSHQRDELESLLIEGGIERAHPEVGGDVDTNFFSPSLEQCILDPSGQSTSAEWIRFAYHDMATHNVNGDGLGGLDGSLRFELDRPENVGNGMFPVAIDIAGFTSPYISYSDTMVAGMINTIVACKGPVIPFRGGRIDAMEAGPAGVPEPQGTLDDHIKSFEKQGFNRTEMIELVACGHTLGGVTNQDFPDIVSEPKPEEGRVTAFFDTTNEFDNLVVEQYLSGTTTNPLVVHANQTIVSDLRIFNSDGNQTMKALANPQYFQSRCSVLLERMFNTVPRGTVLTDVITPIPVKVGRSVLSLSNSSLALETDIRFLDNNPQRKVTLKWTDRAPGSSNQTHSAAAWNVSSSIAPMTKRLGIVPTYHYFRAPINATTSVSKFWFEVDEGKGTGPIVYDNGGQGYPIQQDDVVYANHLSWLEVFPTPTAPAGWTVIVGVRNNQALSSITTSVVTYDAVDKPTTTSLPLTLVAPGGPSTSVQGFSLYEMKMPFGGEVDKRFHFDVTVQYEGGRTVKEEYMRSLFITDRRSDF